MSTLLQDIEDDLEDLYDPEFGFCERVETLDGYILGVFEDSYLLADAGGDVGVRSSSPVLRTRTTDALAELATVIIRGQQYQVLEPMPNGYGETMHNLRRI